MPQKTEQRPDSRCMLRRIQALPLSGEAQAALQPSSLRSGTFAACASHRACESLPNTPTPLLPPLCPFAEAHFSGMDQISSIVADLPPVLEDRAYLAYC